MNRENRDSDMTIAANETILCMIDMQEKFAPAIHAFDECLAASVKLMAAAKEMNVKTVVTEQYPKGLGQTVAPLRELFTETTERIEKLSFSCFGSESFRKSIMETGCRNLVIAGIESHICVLQTAIDAAERGFSVYLAADAVSSRREQDKQLALDFLRSRGVNVLSTESVIFMILGSAESPFFKNVQKIIK